MAGETVAEAEVVHVPHTHEALAWVDTYVRVRAEFALPPIRWNLVGDQLRLTFDSVPGFARIDALSAAEVVLILRRLARLEDALGRNLARVPAHELRYDGLRKIPVLTAGLFVAPGDGPAAVRALLEAAGIAVEHDPHSIRAAVATLAATLPGGGGGDDDASLVRALLDASVAEREAGRPQAAAAALRHAWALRPGDAEVGQHWLELANDFGVGVPPDLEVALEPAAEGNVGLLSALTRRAASKRDPTTAVRLARELTKLAPDRVLGWKVLAMSARHDPGSETFATAMLGLARAGEVQALMWAWDAMGPEAVGPVLDDWAHEWTPPAASLKIRWLAHQERLRDLLQFYFAIGERVRPLEAVALYAVVKAASRLPGRMQALRERMRQLLEAATEPDLVRAYVEACVRDQVPEAVVEAGRMWPALVPPGPLAKAFLALGRFDEAIRYAVEANLPEVRLHALVRRALARGARAPGGELLDVVRQLGRRSDAVRAQLADLQRAAPTSAIASQLRLLTEETG